MILSVYPLPLITYTHDASTVLIGDGGECYAYEEEKLSRFQYAISDFPEKSTLMGLKSVGVRAEDIDHLVITSMESCGSQPGYESKVRYVKDLLSLREDVRVDCIDHHLAHTSLAVLSSPFEECIFLTMDAGGDGRMGHWGIFKENHFNIVEHFELSPAILYAYITCLTGFSLFEEGKVMGLSSYGTVNAELYSWLARNFWIGHDRASLETSEEVNLQWVSELKPQMADADALRRHKYFRLGVKFHNEGLEWMSDMSPLEIACTGQRFFEELVLNAVTNITKRTTIRNIALGGGAFQNIVLNGKLKEAAGMNTYVSMAPHDAGLALGAGLFVYHQHTSGRPPHPVSPYLGPSFDNPEIEDLIKTFSLSYERPANLCGVVAEYVAQGRVVGWFQGRAEFGARALGARSVLADPRNKEAKAKVNQNLKKRDWFMPYAPSVLEEYGDEYFENFSPSPYMNIGFRVKQEKIDFIPSAVHVDGTCRAHTVNANSNPKFYQLIKHFHAITGIPMILNTSFNRHGVPIVATPRQAIQHLLEGNVDLLAIEDFIVYREYLPRQHSLTYSEAYYLGWMVLLFSSKVLKRGRPHAARRALVNHGLPIHVTPDALEVAGKTIWSVNESEEHLRSWWDNFWLATAGDGRYE